MEEQELIEIGNDLYGSFVSPAEGAVVSVPDKPAREHIGCGVFANPAKAGMFTRLRSCLARAFRSRLLGAHAKDRACDTSVRR